VWKARRPRQGPERKGDEQRGYTSQAMFRAEGTPKPSLRIPASSGRITARRGFPPLKPRTQRRAALWNPAQRKASPWNPAYQGRPSARSRRRRRMPSLAPLPDRAPASSPRLRQVRPFGYAPASRVFRSPTQEDAIHELAIMGKPCLPNAPAVGFRTPTPTAIALAATRPAMSPKGYRAPVSARFCLQCAASIRRVAP
jgi:hypothetical protein